MYVHSVTKFQAIFTLPMAQRYVPEFAVPREKNIRKKTDVCTIAYSAHKPGLKPEKKKTWLDICNWLLNYGRVVR